MRLVALAALALGGCYLAHERPASSNVSCEPAGPPMSCTAWMPVGDSIAISPAPPPSGGIQLQSTVATECGVLVSWTTLSGMPIPMNLAFETRAIDWSGSPTAPVIEHPSLSVVTNASGSIELAVNRSQVGALVVTEPTGCRFLLLDAAGNETGAPLALHATSCIALAAQNTEFTFLAPSTNATTSTWLDWIDPSVGAGAQAILPIPAPRAVWSRTVFADQSFLVYSFREDPMTGMYSGWAQHFDAAGGLPAPEVVIDANAAPVLFAETRNGAVTAWETATPGGLPARSRAIDHDGQPRGEVIDLPATGALYGVEIASTPDGGAVISWLEMHYNEMPEWRFQIQQVDADAHPRAAPTLAMTGIDIGAPRILVDPSGERAVLIFEDVGVRALPLRCVH
jgi:hypothetical protein